MLFGERGLPGGRGGERERRRPARGRGRSAASRGPRRPEARLSRRAPRRASVRPHGLPAPGRSPVATSSAALVAASSSCRRSRRGRRPSTPLPSTSNWVRAWSGLQLRVALGDDAGRAGVDRARVGLAAIDGAGHRRDLLGDPLDAGDAPDIAELALVDGRGDRVVCCRLTAMISAPAAREVVGAVGETRRSTRTSTMSEPPSRSRLPGAVGEQRDRGALLGGGRVAQLRRARASEAVPRACRGRLRMPPAPHASAIADPPAASNRPRT